MNSINNLQYAINSLTNYLLDKQEKEKRQGQEALSNRMPTMHIDYANSSSSNALAQSTSLITSQSTTRPLYIRVLDALEELLSGANSISEGFTKRWRSQLWQASCTTKEIPPSDIQVKIDCTHQLFDAIDKIQTAVFPKTPDNANLSLFPLIEKYLNVLKNSAYSQEFEQFVKEVTREINTDNASLSYSMPLPTKHNYNLLSATINPGSLSYSTMAFPLTDDQEDPEKNYKDRASIIDSVIREINLYARQIYFCKEFPPNVLKEVEKFSEEDISHSIWTRRDLRKEIAITIDPDSAQDFDDALSLKQIDQNRYCLGVHIADVSHYVKPGSQLDLEAQKRGNSTYFPGTCFPMIPHELSNNLCSLRPNKARLTITQEMIFNTKGVLLSQRIFKSVIESKERFNYKTVKQILDGRIESNLRPLLKMMEQLASIFQKQRIEREALMPSNSEVLFHFDNKGQPIRFELIEHDIAHQIVEEFMLKANEAMATHLAKQGKIFPYRVHPAPKKAFIGQFQRLAYSTGYSSLSKDPTKKELATIFDQNSPSRDLLSQSFIRRMPKAYYSTENIGHYGLGLSNYSHCTSPIRRYIDIIIQRTLFGEGSYSPQDLMKISQHCSETEGISSKAERAVNKRIQTLFAYQSYCKDPQKMYHLTVINITPSGIDLTVEELAIQTLLKLPEWEFDGTIFISKDQENSDSIRLGNRLSGRIKTIDLVQEEILWSDIQFKY